MDKYWSPRPWNDFAKENLTAIYQRVLQFIMVKRVYSELQKKLSDKYTWTVTMLLLQVCRNEKF